jgi:branched-chain amino acid transport system permease protein
MVFTFSAVLAALAGSLYAHFMNFIDPNSFESLFFHQAGHHDCAGRHAQHLGAMIGATLIAFLSFEWLHHFGEFEVVVYGAVLLLVVIFLPNGLAGLPKMVMERIRR